MIPEAGSLFSVQEHRELLEAAIKAGTRAERHNREWRMGQFSVSDDLLNGRIGFTKANASTEVWSDRENDFVEEAYPNGYTSPFVIRTADLVIVFQLRSGQIKFQSFAGALQALMRAASGDAWRVAPIVKPVTYEKWRASVERVVVMRFALEPPNPSYKDRPLVQQAIQETGAEMLSLVLKSDADDLAGLDTDAALVRQAVDHAQRGYGHFKADGVRMHDDAEPETVKFDSEEGETGVVPVPANPETGEVAHETLRAEVREREVESEQESDKPV